MSTPTSRPALIAAFLVIALLGVAGGYWWAKLPTDAPPVMKASAKHAVVEPAAPIYWYDPMQPEQHFDKPGKSPFMDMQLVPKYAEPGVADGVRVAPAAQQNLGIRTGIVEVGRLDSQIRVPGTLTWDLRSESVLSARFDSIVSHLQVKAPYEPVRRGQALVNLFAPASSSAIAEARALGQAQSSAARSLQSAAQQRLRVLGIAGGGSDGSVTLRSPSDGVVSEVLVREGQTVLTGTPLLRVNGTATMWLEAAVPQASTGGIRRGTPVTATVSALPGRIFGGEVEALLPQIDAGSRTQRARVVLRNADGVLVPGMFAELILQPQAGASRPLIPSEALIATGSDNRVVVLGSDGSFVPVRVQTGRSGGGRTEILSGLKGGERVVTSGQFLIDSEASLSGALGRLDSSKPPGDSGARK